MINFYETYFKEVCFVGFMAFLTLCTILSDKNGTSFVTVNAALLAIAFFAGIFCLNCYADSSKKISSLFKLTTMCAMLIFGCTYYFCPEHFANYGQAMILALLLCYISLSFHEETLRKYQRMNSEERIRHDIAKGYELTEEQQLKLMKMPDVKELILRYLRYYNFEPAAEVALLDQPWAKSYLEYDTSYELSDEACAHLFDLPNASEMVYTYVNNGHTLHENLLMNIFGLPNAAEIMAEYVTLIEMPLPEDIELKMLALPNAKELISIYRRKFDMHDDATKIAQAKGFI